MLYIFAAWLHAFRLRTLPLSFSAVITGSFLAGYHFSFRWEVAILALLTALFLQILSNLSNDYGDSIHGADNAERIGPQRAIQSGSISVGNMKKAIVIFAVLAFLSGLLLLYVSLNISLSFFLFLSLGLLAIAAAIRYTVGNNPYGYKGLGDVFVFIFFGIVGVEGTFYLHTHRLLISGLLPASVIGLLSVAVLNLNNMRDHIADAQAGKNTLVVKMGFNNAKKYHASLIIIAFLCALAFALINFIDRGMLMPFLSLLVFSFLFIHLKKVMQTEHPARLDAELKKVTLSVLAYSILFGLGLFF
jgi:1,4-dihydroxy-2-naphthoate octaprenyltransferase